MWLSEGEGEGFDPSRCRCRVDYDQLTVSEVRDRLDPLLGFVRESYPGKEMMIIVVMMMMIMRRRRRTMTRMTLMGPSMR
jgi:hypothetical protein